MRRDDFTTASGVSGRATIKERSTVQQAQPSRIPLTPRQRIFLTLLFLLALTLSYFVVPTVDPLASHLRLFSTNEPRVNAQHP